MHFYKNSAQECVIWLIKAGEYLYTCLANLKLIEQAKQANNRGACTETEKKKLE